MEYECTLLRANGEWRFESRLVRMDRPFPVKQMVEPHHGAVEGRSA